MDEIFLHATFYLFLQTDGASACLIMSEDKALEMGFKPKAYLRYYEIKLKKCCYSIHFPVIYSLCPLLPLFSIGILYMSHRIPKISFYWGNFYISNYTELEFRILSFWTLWILHRHMEVSPICNNFQTSLLHTQSSGESWTQVAGHWCFWIPRSICSEFAF